MYRQTDPGVSLFPSQTPVTRDRLTDLRALTWFPAAQTAPLPVPRPGSLKKPPCQDVFAGGGGVWDCPTCTHACAHAHTCMCTRAHDEAPCLRSPDIPLHCLPLCPLHHCGRGDSFPKSQSHVLGGAPCPLKGARLQGLGKLASDRPQPLARGVSLDKFSVTVTHTYWDRKSSTMALRSLSPGPRSGEVMCRRYSCSG